MFGSQIAKVAPRYGQNDYKFFTVGGLEPAILDTQVGSAKIRKAEIDCRCRWSEAQWGCLEKYTPAGIIYNDITIKQPPNHWLRSARICITMSESTSSYALGPGRRSRDDHEKRPRVKAAQDWVQITPFFGPLALLGPETVTAKSKTAEIAPSIGAMGTSLGGVGISSRESREERSSRWQFRGVRTTPWDCKTYRTLEWVFTGDEKSCGGSGSSHNTHTFNTAFAFEHRGDRPVCMRIEIEGELGNLFHRGVKLFSSHFNNRDKSVLTGINFTEGFTFEKRLANAANELDRMMFERYRASLPWRGSETRPLSPTTEGSSSPEQEEETRLSIQNAAKEAASTKALLGIFENKSLMTTDVAKPKDGDKPELSPEITPSTEVANTGAYIEAEEGLDKRVRDLLNNRAILVMAGFLVMILEFLYPPSPQRSKA